MTRLCLVLETLFALSVSVGIAQQAGVGYHITKTYELGTYERNEDLYLDIEKLTKWDDNVKPFTIVTQGE